MFNEDANVTDSWPSTCIASCRKVFLIRFAMVVNRFSFIEV